MELKLTTVRAMKFEERTGRDILDTLNSLSTAAQEGRTPTLRQLLDIFSAMGDNYDAETFDAWDVPLVDKIYAIADAVQVYMQGKNGKAISPSSSQGATRMGSSHKR
jgi:hypothetical protein|nr:MAG TPA: hypothetical protein [Caudoviricetes sp.]